MTDSNKNSYVAIESENKILHDQVNQLQSQIQEIEVKYKELQSSNESKQSAEQPIPVIYPRLAVFTTAQDYIKIELNDSKGTIKITEPVLLNSISNLFIIKKEALLGSGPQADIEPIQYLLTTPHGTVKVNIVQQGVVTFEDLYPGIYFEVDNNAYQLGKAFMNRPSYMSNEPVIAKMVNSGLIKVGEKDTFYVFIAGRVRSVALAFFNSNKRESVKPKNTLAAELNMTFYYYGEEIQLNLYKGKAQIKYNNGENWYDLEDEDVNQIISKLSAS
ncbi:hypothetical protein QFZ81_001545 [Paenibacillus sp. V4I9]|uniref:hypothetical protein n=1 Tax=Paenibacillus sp. V4I9 TaxID=3042308 RepID=UPI00277F4134|nr:hypothetical protein [Paenibacillus sp. V4I9]MDQ0886457.1 hypothetical protein [Paenibacillus sp. V4I9]